MEEILVNFAIQKYYSFKNLKQPILHSYNKDKMLLCVVTFSFKSKIPYIW